MIRKLFIILPLALTGLEGVAQEKTESSPTGKIVYQNNFENAEIEKVPADFLVLDGGFAVKQEGTNKFLELPGAPLDAFGVLFGPTIESEVAVSARIRGAAKGRRFPTFAVGLNGVGGYKLQVSPAKKLLELYKGDEVVASAPFDTKLDSWLTLRLENRKTGMSGWKVSAKVWSEKSTEPKEPAITFEEKSKPVAGRASIWGSPYSGTPIHFDDLKVTAATPE